MKCVSCVKNAWIGATLKTVANGFLQPFTRIIAIASLMLIACLATSETAGATDNVISFDAVGERVATTGRVPTTDFSIEAWFKLSAYTAENQIFSQYQGGHSGRFIVGVQNDKAGMFIGGVGGGWHLGTESIPLNFWHHIAVTRSGSTCKIYINGSEYLSKTITANVLPSADFVIGNIHSTGPGFRGEISDVRIWNTVRTESQIDDNKGVRLTGSESGLEHYWKLDEGTGTSAEDTAAAGDGTVYGATWTTSSDLPVLETQPTSGDYALFFDSSTDIVDTTARISTVDFSVEAWFRLTSQSGELQLFSQYGGGTGRFILGLQSGKPGFFIGGYTSGWVVDTEVIPLDTWTHYAFTRSGSTCKIYINGSEYLSSDETSALIESADIDIGGIMHHNPGFRGDISDVRIWNTARSQSEIAGSKDLRLTGSESGLIYYWPLNEGAGATVEDICSSADGTITDATWAYRTELPILTELPDSGSWIATTGGEWSTSGNWLDSSVPNGAGIVALFTNQPPAEITVSNDVTGLSLGQITINATSNHTFTGNSLTLTNEATPRLLSTEGSHTFDLPIVTTGVGLDVETLSPASLSFIDVISGSGDISVNPASSGGGTVTFETANTYIGATVLGSGTFITDTLANGGVASPLGASSSDPSNLVLGPGTLSYTGGSTTTDRGYTVDAGAGKAAVLHSDSDITFAGQIAATSGSLIKTGTGTLSYTYAGYNQPVGNEGSTHNGLIDFKENGDSPTIGFTGMSIIDGRVIMGVPGQTNYFNSRIDVGMYSTTNAAAEKSPELVINDGTFICTTTLSIGRNNGNTNTAPEGTTSKLTINGGECYLALVAAGHNALNQPGFNPRSIYEINGGYVEQSRSVNMGEHAGSQIAMNVNGGHLNVKETGASIRLGAGTGEGTLTMRGDAVVEAAGYIMLAQGGATTGKGTCNLNGGTLIASDIRKGTGLSGIMNFNGGVFKPHTAGEQLDGLTAAYVSTNGAVIDTSTASYSITQDLLHDADLGGTADGGLTKIGTGTLTLGCTSPTYTGPTVVSNGTLLVTGVLPDSSSVTVENGADLAVGGSIGSTLDVSALTLSGNGMVTLDFAADGSANDKLSSPNSPSLGNGQIALLREDNQMPFTENGTYTIMTYTGSDPVVSGLTCANPVFGKTYTFAASGGNVTLTIATDTTGASVWDVNFGGAWATAGNWTVAPADASGSQVRFDDVISGPATVTSAGETVGEIYFNNPYTYTIGGTGLTLDNDALDGSIVVESGSHAITAPLALANDTTVSIPSGSTFDLGALSGGSSTLSAVGGGSLYLTAAPSIQALNLDLPALGLSSSMTVTPDVELSRTVYVAPAQDTSSTISGTISGSGGLVKAYSSTLEVTADNSYSGGTTVSAGTLKIDDLADGGNASPIGAATADPANLVLGKATLHITGTNTTDRGYILQTESSSYAGVLRVDGETTFGGQILAYSGPFLKTGPGTLYYTYAGANQLNRNDPNAANGLQNIGVNGDGPNAGVTGFTVTQGKVVLGVAGQVNTIAGHLDIGLYTSTEPGGETAGELVLNDGTLTTSGGTASVGRNNGTETTAPGGVSSRLTINGGVFSCGTLASGNNGAGLSGYNARPVIEVNGGEVNVGGTYLSVGESPGSYAALLVSGGSVNIYNDGRTLRMGGWQASSGGDGIVVLSDTGSITVNGVVQMAYATGSENVLRLDGGTLTARNIVVGDGERADVYFNGGTFVPSAVGQTLTGLTMAAVSTNGAVIDASLQSYTIAQTLTTDPGLNGATDGGLTKLGTNTLALTSAANTFNGVVSVEEGTLQATLGATNDLFVADGAVFDALGQRVEVGDLSGEGLLTNGTIAVHGVLDCGIVDAPAGAAMTVEDLAMTAGSTFVCEWATNAVGEVTNDFVTVTGNVAGEGRGFIDFNRDSSNPIPIPFETTIMSYGTTSGSFIGWTALNTGLPAGTSIATIVKAEDNVVTVKVTYGGTLIIIQ